MFRVLARLALVVAVLLGGAASAFEGTSGVTLVESGPGYELYSVSNQTYRTSMFKATGTTPTSTADRLTYKFSNLQGVMSANLPQVIKNEISKEYQAQLDAGATPASIDLGTEFVDVIAAQEYAAVVGASTDPTTQLFGCGGYWDMKKKNWTVNLTPSTANVAVTSAGFNGNMTTDPGLNGTIKMSARYSLRKNDCTGGIPYRARFDGVDAVGTVNFTNTRVTLNGYTASYSSAADLITPTTLFHGEFDFGILISVVYIPVELTLDVKAGLKAAANASIQVSGDIIGSGYAMFNVTRAGNGQWIENTPTDVDFYTTTTVQPMGAVEAQIELLPYIVITPGIDIGLYFEGLSLVKGFWDFRFGLPLSAWGYVGNMCGDANYDGNNEMVRGFAVSAEASFDLTRRIWVLGDWDVDHMSMNFTRGWHPRTWGLIADYQPRSKLLKFWDLGDGGASSVFSPVVYAGFQGNPATHNDRGGIIVSQRPCLPWPAGSNLSIQWGDTTTSTASVSFGGSIVPHDWPASGNRTVVVKSLSDDYGRVYRTPTPQTTKVVVTSATGVSYTVPGTPPTLTVLQVSGKGDMKVDWNAAIGTVERYELFEATKADFSDQELLTPGFNAVAGQAAYQHTFKRTEARYYYRIRACVGPLCSVYRTLAAPVDVDIEPGETEWFGPGIEVNSTGVFTLDWGVAPGMVTRYELKKTSEDGKTILGTAWSGLALSKEFDIRQDADVNYRVRACNNLWCGPYSTETVQVHVTYIEDGHEIQ